MRRRRWATLMATMMTMAVAAAVVPPAPDHVRAVAPASITPVVTGIDPAATAVLANVTMVGERNSGYITGGRCSTMQAGAQATSNGNFAPGQIVANLAIVPVDTDGRFCLANSAPVELLADVQGFVAPSSTGLRYEAGDGARVLDTRITPSTPAGAGTITRVATGARAGARAVLANITMVNGAGVGYVTADACSTLQPGAQTRSNGNFNGAAAVSNIGIVPVDANGDLCIYAQQRVDLVVDVQGWFIDATDAGLGFDALALPRALDTRVAPSTRPTAGSITRVASGAPAGTAAVMVNLTMVGASAPGYVTAAACSKLVAGPQTRSNGNFVGVTAVSNVSVVPVDADGSFCIYAHQAVDLVVDVQGAFRADGTQRFFVATPKRVLDTRPPEPTPPTPSAPSTETSCTSVVHIGDSTSVGMISTDYIKDPSLRIDAQYRRVGVENPNMQISGARSIVETLRGQANAYDVAAAIKATGYHGCWVFALGTTDTANIAAGSGPGRAVRIEKMMNLVAGDPVMWVNLRSYVADGPWSAANALLWNRALDQVAPNYPNLHVYDWYSVAQSAWFAGDRLHYSVDGYIIRGHLIADALAVAFPA